MGRALAGCVNLKDINSYIFILMGRKAFATLRGLRWHFLASLLCLPFFAAAALPAATHIQQASNSNVTGKAMTSMAATFSAPTTAGNAILIGVTYGNVNPTITATDSQGNTYVQAIKTYDSGHRQGSAILYATNIKGETNNTVTVKFSSSVAYLAVGIHEYSGLAASGALDVTAGVTGKGASPSSPAAKTTAGGDLVFGCAVEDSIGRGDTFTAGAGFAKRVDLGNAAAYADEDSVQTTAGSIAATWTLSPSSTWLVDLAAFKTTGGAQAPVAPVISGLSPASGPVGTSVTISGTNFGATKGTSTVSFSSITASTTSWSSTAIVATVPVGTNTGNVNVTVSGLPSNNVVFSVTQLPIAVALSPASFGLQVAQSQVFTATLQNDAQHLGVTWSLTGGGCSGLNCGALTNATTTSVTYTAPTVLPTPATVTLQAISIADATKSALAAITLVAAPAISVSISPSSTSVQVSSSTALTASVLNDSQNKGVTWSLSGAGCQGITCGSLSNQTTSSVTYTAPAALPSPATVSLQATSVTDATKSATATITLVATPPISVTVSPTSASLQTSASAGLAASVLNDSQNQGVTWNMSGAACSAGSCGTFTNVTTSSVTYNAPASVPSSPTVTLTATSVANPAKLATATITLTQPTTGNGVPTFAENHVSGSSTQGYTVNSFVLRLPNPSLAGNCIVVGFQYSSGAGVTPSVSDDQGNSYSSPVQSTDGNQVVNLSYALNVAPGAQKITITFSGSSPSYVSAVASEFYNVASANAADGFAGSSGSSGTVSAGTLTTVNSGDLIYQYAIQDSTSAAMTSWTQGVSPWVLLSTDLLDGAAAQYQIQPTAAPITPALGMSPAENFVSVAIALKAASAGTTPPPGIRVVRVQHNAVPEYTSSPIRLQFPSSGNLLVVSWIGAPGIDITGVTDAKGNSYVSTGPAFGYGVSGDNQLYYAAGAATSSTLSGPTLATTGSQIGGSTALLFDIRGAATAPYDSAAGRATASGNDTADGNSAGATISPTTANGLIITSIGIDSNTIVGVSPGNLQSTVPAPVSSPNPVDQNNGWALFYNPTPGPETFTWTPQGGPLYNWASIAVAFMAAPN